MKTRLLIGAALLAGFALLRWWPLTLQIYCWITLALAQPATAGESSTAGTPGIGPSSLSVQHLQGAAWQVVTVDLRAQRLRLIGQGHGEPRTFSGLDAWADAQDVRLVAATNAAIFETIHEPTGLWVQAGLLHQPLNPRPGRGNFYLQPNGVLSVEGDRARIRPTAEVAAEMTDPARLARLSLALQSGPLLLDGGQPHPRLLPGSTSRYSRNAVGRLDDHRLVLAYTPEPVTLYQTALALRDLGATDALYLDGTISGMCGGRGCKGGLWAGMLVVTEAP